jgi:hypothetical protein
VFSACSSDNPTQTNNSDTTSSETTTAAAETEPALDLPDTDMNGKTFTFLTCNWPGEDIWEMTEITIDDYNGNAVNDAMYARNSNVKDRLNCDIYEINIPSSGDAVTSLRKSIQAGDNAYDIFIPRMQTLTTLIIEKLILDLNDLNYIDFSKPWWDSGSIEGLSLNHKQYGVNSYMTTMDKGAISTFVFNKSILDDYSLDSPYGYVLDGTWTLDVFNSQIKAVSQDLNGDGIMDKDDLYGLMYQRDTLHDLLVTSGEAVAKKGADDLPYISLNTDGAISKIQTLLSVLYNKEACFNSMTLPGDFNVAMNTKFQDNQGLYMWIRMVNIVPLRTMEADFGIVVMPKFDESISDYSSTVNPYTGIYICVPSSNSDTDNTGIFLEAMAYEGYKNVKNAYYDTLLNGIIARDEESSQMLDILFNNRFYDLGIICDFGDLKSFIYMVINNEENIVSYVDTRIDKANSDLEKLNAALTEG